MSHSRTSGTRVAHAHAYYHCHHFLVYQPYSRVIPVDLTFPVAQPHSARDGKASYRDGLTPVPAPPGTPTAASRSPLKVSSPLRHPTSVSWRRATDAADLSSDTWAAQLLPPLGAAAQRCTHAALPFSIAAHRWNLAAVPLLVCWRVGSRKIV